MSATAGVTEQLLDMIGGRGREVYDLILAGKAAYAAPQQEAEQIL